MVVVFGQAKVASDAATTGVGVWRCDKIYRELFARRYRKHESELRKYDSVSSSSSF